MKRILKIVLVCAIVIVILSGIGYGSVQILKYVQEREKEKADYVSIPMKLEYANDFPDFYEGRGEKQEINFEGLVTDKEKILHILQVADFNLINAKYLAAYKKGNTNMTASVNKPISQVNIENDLLLKSSVISEQLLLYNFEDATLINSDGKECSATYEQRVFFMSDFINEGKHNAALHALLPMAIEALNKGGYLVIYDKIYYKTAKFPRYIEESDSFEMTDDKLYIEDFLYLPNGDIDNTLVPISSVFPFHLTDEIISSEDLFIEYDAEERLYRIRFKINSSKIDAEYAEKYFSGFLDFEGGVLKSYSCEIEIWENGLIKSINEDHNWSVIYDTGIKLYLHMDMPLQSITYFSYNKVETDVISKLELME